LLFFTFQVVDLPGLAACHTSSQGAIIARSYTRHIPHDYHLNFADDDSTLSLPGLLLLLLPPPPPPPHTAAAAAGEVSS